MAFNLRHRHFLKLEDFSREEILFLLDLAADAIGSETEPEVFAGIQLARARGLVALGRGAEAIAAAERAWTIAMQPQRPKALIERAAGTYADLLRPEAPAAAQGVLTAAAARCLAAPRCALPLQLEAR